MVEHGDAPDFRCVDDLGATLNVEITLMQERGDDIKGLRGRSTAHSIDSLRKNNALVAVGKAHPMQFARTPQDHTVRGLVVAIEKKLTKSYGRNTALVVGETCPLDWDWDLIDLTDLHVWLRAQAHSFDKGIWLIESTDRVRRVG
ncbi:MAG: hypothetical protein ACRDUX_35590 [Mycobacterium sp.]